MKVVSIFMLAAVLFTSCYSQHEETPSAKQIITRISPGMSKKEVVRALGSPTKFPKKQSNHAEESLMYILDIDRDSDASEQIGWALCTIYFSENIITRICFSGQVVVHQYK